MNRYYLSFVDRTRAVKDRFLGACIVEAENVEGAIRRAWELEINPGGECMIADVPEVAYYLPLNRLMDRAELEKYGPTHRLGDYRNN
jgi:hypothetical protein